MFNRKLLGPVLLAAIVAAAAISPAHAAKVGDIVFFGDSLSDTGNVWYAIGYPPPPYNQGTQGAPPDRTGGQWSDQLGPSWPTVLAHMYNQYATPSLVGGNNYAWGGARTGVNPDATGVPWLNQQVGQYVLGSGSPDDHTLFSVVIGGNDVANNLTSAAAAAAAIQAGMANITASINALYAAGGRQFLVASVPDIGATPEFQGRDQQFPGLAAFASAVTVQWNMALDATLAALNLADAHIYFLDLYALGKDPELLAGYANTTDPCLVGDVPCADPGSYFYWDSFHPSSTTHAAIARFAAQAIGVPEPAALALMLLGLGGMALAARRRARA